LNRSIGNSMQNTITNLSKISPLHQEFLKAKENDTDDSDDDVYVSQERM